MRPDYFDTALSIGTESCPDRQWMEFHINARIRKICNFDETLFASNANVIFSNQKAVHLFIQKYNATVDGKNHPEGFLKAGQLNAMGLIDEVFHYVCRQYRVRVKTSFFSGAAEAIEAKVGKHGLDGLLAAFSSEFPPMPVYRGKTNVETWLEGTDADGIPHRILALEEMMLLRLANENPAFAPFYPLFNDKVLLEKPEYLEAWHALRSWSVQNPPFGPEGLDLISMLKAPVEYSPYDLKGQLEYINTRWMAILGEWLARLLSGIDLIAEEEKAGWSGGIGSGTPDIPVYEFGDISKEYERFSPDRDWMPNVVLMAKSVLVWLSQLTEKYQRPITRLDQIPDEELDFLAQSGFTGLWLIGLWERSPASARIKQICGNPEAAASAYSLDDYDIAGELGGWDALNNLRVRAWHRGIRMASDMVPNHTGMDAKWVVEKPDLFVQTRDCPFPGYDFAGENLSHDSRVGIYLESHYYSKSDCAVVFKRVDNSSGDVRYIYHGNDGTGMPWNDTAQIDFLSPVAREEVIQKILNVARNFPIIRFDAAMVLAKKHIQRLWYPEPGHGGDIASRSQHALTRDEFERRIPEEFWREVVDRCAKEIPDTLLLAEAFWMMEGYFVRTLGMHRVYNSAFMNMLKREDNAKYRSTIKNTIEFDPEILKRYVNFMNNPDEETASVQFGRDDKYIGVCTMMVAMPGLPMFGHGQIEGFEEKYGMEYRRAYKNETPDDGLLERHRHEIFPLMKKRWLFTGVENFLLYDFFENSTVNENVFVWSNRVGAETALIFFNNCYNQASGWIKTSAAYAEKRADGTKELTQRNLADGLGLKNAANRFCIMQEQRSGLWYLRTSREISESGMFASLNGFQTQVFINIYEVEDSSAGHYRTLYESLKGHGIADVFMGIQNIRLKKLYAALSEFASPEYFKSVRLIVGKKTAPASAGTPASTSAAGRTDGTVKARSVPEMIAGKALQAAEKLIGKPAPADNVAETVSATEKPAKEFFAVCSEFLDGNYGAQDIIGKAPRAKKPDLDTLWSRYSLSLEKLLHLGELDGSDKNAAHPAALGTESLGVAKTLNAVLQSSPEMIEAFAATLILNTVRDLSGDKTGADTARALIDLWSLDRKAADLLADYGMAGSGALSRLRQLKEIPLIADIAKSGTHDPTADILRAWFDGESTKKMAGVHTWDNIVWFNKEDTERLTDLQLLLSALSSRPAASPQDDKPPAAKPKPAVFSWKEWNADLAAFSKTRKTLLTAFAESGYQVEKLTARFAEPEKKPKATAAKPAVPAEKKK